MATDLIHKDFFNPLFLFSNLRPKYLTPDIELDSLYEIDINGLKERNIKGIIFDVDNTLCPYHGISVDSKVRDSFNQIKEEFRTCVLSNTTSERVQELEKYFGLHVIKSKIKKPRVEPYLEAMEYLGTSPEETAMVGDRLLTDIVGANRAGMLSIKVKPVDFYSDPKVLWLARGV